MRHLSLAIGLACSFTSSCLPLPLWVGYYEPTASGSERRQSTCQDQVGPFDKVVFSGPRGVNVDVVSRSHEKGILVCLSITVPKGVTVRFLDNLFVARSLPSGSETSRRVSVMSAGHNYPESCGLWTESPRDIFAPLEGGFKRPSPWKSFNMPYYSALMFDGVDPDRFSLTLPALLVDGDEFSIPEVVFRRTHRFVVYPLNC